MPVIHERAEDSGLYIKSLIQGSGWVTWQISDYGAEILRKFRLARDGKAITKSTLLKMIACKLVYTNTSGTSQSIDLDNEINPNLKMSNEERQLFEYIKDNEKQIQNSVKIKVSSKQKNLITVEAKIKYQQDNYPKSSNKNISKHHQNSVIEIANNFHDLFLRKDPIIMEAILRKFVYGNLPTNTDKYQNEEAFNKIITLLPSNYCNFCKTHIADIDTLIYHIKTCHQSLLTACFEHLFKVFLKYKTSLNKKERSNYLKNLEKIKIYTSTFYRINMFQLYEYSDKQWELAVNNLTTEQKTTAVTYRRMLKFLSTEAAQFPSLTSGSKIKIVPVSNNVLNKNPVIQSNLTKWFNTPEGAEAFLRYCIFNNLPSTVKSYRKQEYFNKCEKLFDSKKCPLCQKVFNHHHELTEHVIKYHYKALSNIICICFLSYSNYKKYYENNRIKRPIKNLMNLESTIKNHSNLSLFKIFDPYQKIVIKNIHTVLLQLFTDKEQLTKTKNILSIYLSMINEANHGFNNSSLLTISTNSEDYSIDFDSLIKDFTEHAIQEDTQKYEELLEESNNDKVTIDNPIETTMEDAVSNSTENTTEINIQNAKVISPIVLCDLRMELINCPAGDFYMGSPNRELGHAFDESFHHVTIDNDFYISKFPITQSQYKKLTNNNPSKYKNTNYPVTNITRKMALDYCDKLNKLYSSLIPEGYYFDLPTEAQWEYACKAECITSLYNDLELTTKEGICLNLNKLGYYAKNSNISPQQVGQKTPNNWGIYDMLGNVYEWCKDLYSEDYSGKQELNDSNPEDRYSYVVKGGCYNSDAVDCRIAARGAEFEDNSDEYIGFRVVLVRDQEPTTEELLKTLTEPSILEKSESILSEDVTCEELHNLLNELPRLTLPLNFDKIPQNGIYFIFEKGEMSHGSDRIVYVGSHDVDGRLPARLKEHFNICSKDGSILRKNIGRAILNKSADSYLETWDIDFSLAKNKNLYESKRNKQYEQNIENQVTGYINNSFTVAVLEVADKEERKKLQKQIISVINNCEECKPSKYWLGHFSPKPKIANGKLWMEKY